MADPMPTLAIHETEKADLPFKREVKRRLDAIDEGHVAAWTFEGTLTADGAATTTLFQHDGITSTSQVSLHPLTADAASLLDKIWIGGADLEPALPWNALEISQLTVNHPALAVGTVATLRFSCKG